MRRFLTGRTSAPTGANDGGATSRNGRLKLRSTWAMILAGLAAGLMFALFPSAGFGTLQPTIASDKTDYPPGSTVTLTGGNWDTATTSSAVHIHVDDNLGNPWVDNIDATPAGDGTMTASFQLSTSLVASYTVTATQTTTSGTLAAATTFTDTGNPSASPEQCANDPSPSPSSDGCTANGDWVTGNVGSSKAV